MACFNSGGRRSLLPVLWEPVKQVHKAVPTVSLPRHLSLLVEWGQNTELGIEIFDGSNLESDSTWRCQSQNVPRNKAIRYPKSSMYHRVWTLEILELEATVKYADKGA